MFLINDLPLVSNVEASIERSSIMITLYPQSKNNDSGAFFNGIYKNN